MTQVRPIRSIAVSQGFSPELEAAILLLEGSTPPVDAWLCTRLQCRLESCIIRVRSVTSLGFPVSVLIHEPFIFYNAAARLSPVLAVEI